MLHRTDTRTEPWGTPLVTTCQSDVALSTLWVLLFRQFITQHSMNLFNSDVDSLSRRLLWGVDFSKAETLFVISVSAPEIIACMLPPLQGSFPLNLLTYEIMDVPMAAVFKLWWWHCLYWPVLSWTANFPCYLGDFILDNDSKYAWYLVLQKTM